VSANVFEAVALLVPAPYLPRWLKPHPFLIRAKCLLHFTYLTMHDEEEAVVCITISAGRGSLNPNTTYIGTASLLFLFAYITQAATLEVVTEKDA